MSSLDGATPHIHFAAPGVAGWSVPGLVGMSVFGPHGVADVARWADFMEWVLTEMPRPFDYLVDAERIRLGDHDWRTFVAVMQWARQNNQRCAGRLRRWVGVTASHAVGMAIAGSNRMLGVPFETHTAPSIDAALALLGRPDRATLVPWIAALPATARALASQRARLQEHLAQAPDATLPATARALGLGARTLQRLLARERTSFRALRREEP